jgi:exodeoxyribonuclease VII large subunit
MSRLPFDPSKMASCRPQPEAAPKSPSSGTSAESASESVWTVSMAAAKLAQALRAGLPTTLRVVGEISVLRERTHWYFDLKDDSAVLACVMFASSARKAGFTPRDGQSVVATGRVDFYAKQGKVSLIVESIRPVGEGAQDLAFRQLCEELRGLGWFAMERKRPIPAFPRRIAVITSATGAALQDVLDTMRRRCPAIEIALLDARVQGEGAASDIVRALRWAGASAARLGLDAVLLTRGGGSKEDLWTFNEREVARAIVESPIPVVAAIGHETDTTIAELVADLRCATPTQAAMRLSPDRSAMLEQLDMLASGLAQRMLAGIKRRARDLESSGRLILAAWKQQAMAQARSIEAVSARLQAKHPASVIARQQDRLGHLERRLVAAEAGRFLEADVEGVASDLDDAIDRRLAHAAERVEALRQRLWAVGPMSVLARGYSVTMRGDGKVVRSTNEVRMGDQLRTRVADGEIASVVGAQADGATHKPVPLPLPSEVDDGHLKTPMRLTPGSKAGKLRAGQKPKSSRASGASRSSGLEGPGLFGL